MSAKYIHYKIHRFRDIVHNTNAKIIVQHHELATTRRHYRGWIVRLDNVRI